MDNSFFIEVNCKQLNHHSERICGDVYLSEKVSGEDRLIIVLSDGMGHGVKANVLATLTSTMALNFTREHQHPSKIAEIIMNTLPACSERNMSYSTFTIIDIVKDGQVNILEYDNPRSQIIRNHKIYQPAWHCIMLESDKNKGKEIHTCSFYPQKEDRIISWSDGVIQSGLGSEKYPFGWGLEDASNYVLKLIENKHDISATEISTKLVNKALSNDNYELKDDTSSVSIYFREPRKLLVCSGPPYEEENDIKLIKAYEEFQGKKVISGATTGDIISKGLNLEIEDGFEFSDPDLPPISFMPGAELITEGILTLSKVNKILNSFSPSTKLNNGPADQMVKLFLESDEINFIIGTRINIAHQDPNLPIELEMRRTVIKRIARLLENKFLKIVSYQYI